MACFEWKADLSGTCGLNLYEGEHADVNYTVSSLILDDDELLDMLMPALQVVSSEVGCCADGKPLDALQVGVVRTLLIGNALPLPLHMKVIMGHERTMAGELSRLRFLTHVKSTCDLKPDSI